MKRTDIIFLIEAAFTAGRPDYACALCQTWLAQAPGDLAIRFYWAKALAAEAQPREALQALETIAAVDFEHAPTYALLATLAPQPAQAAQAAACAQVLDGRPLPAGVESPAWLAPAREGVIALAAGHYETARQHIDSALSHQPTLPLLSLLLLKTHWQARELALTLPLAKGFHDRWPKGVAIMLCLSEGLFRNGDAHQAVELVHTVSALDSAGDLVARYWGASHPYRDLWPTPPAVSLPGPIPAEVIALLGMNRIERKRSGDAPEPAQEIDLVLPTRVDLTGSVKQSQGKDLVPRRAPSAPIAKERLQANPPPDPPPAQTIEREGDLPRVEPLPEDAPTPPNFSTPPAGSEALRDIQSALNAIGAQVDSARSRRQLTHVILFSPQLLTAKFGPPGSAQVTALIAELARVTAQQRRVTVICLTPEAPEFELKRADPTKAWEVKILLHDLDLRLEQQGQAIGSLLIIGGDDLLPFHRLPNPTDDVDEDIPSDNPYGSADDNYFLPEWPVGRLPSPCGRDPEPLCQLLRSTIAAHQAHARQAQGWRAFLAWLFQRWRSAAPPSSVGYAASVWKDAAREVFAPLGDDQDLHTSPPLTADGPPSLSQRQLSYFNLHGVEDGPNWFGQRDESDGYGPLYPVAFEPKHASLVDLPKVIFTEACYGANIIGKAEPDAALCLRFLSNGVCAFVGSTKIAYGAVAPPLIGADMLGRQFWENILSGLPVGEALRRAKVALAYAMHKRQSFLDGEDQKTLISFVLYGDPLLPVVSAQTKNRSGSQPKALPTVKTMTMEYARVDAAEIQTETIAEIKHLLARYLPGAESAQVTMSRPLSPINAKSPSAPTHRVYTLAKTMRATSYSLPHFARVTVNKAGKVVKIAVSR